MPRERTRVFLDASILVAAAKSPSGGSSVALEVCQSRHYRAIVSLRVLLEARKNIMEKFGEAEHVRYYKLLAALDPEICVPAPRHEMERCALLISPKDAHVLASALASHSVVLLTLDRRHFMTAVIQNARLPLVIMTPGDFLKQLLA
ncbi:MAG: PIN domain-containing protein [Dehalococcoidia bacterium]|nr:PIN domain-containing protein [Dehalococcoidia bacterium]